jgi:hypothetical protein
MAFDGVACFPEPAALANHSPRIFIAGALGWEFREACHLFPNRSADGLISKFLIFFWKSDFSCYRVIRKPVT